MKTPIIAWLVWEAGYSVLYEPTAVIRHYESASSEGNEAAKPAMAVNQQKFREKWNDQLRQASALFDGQHTAGSHLGKFRTRFRFYI